MDGALGEIHRGAALVGLDVERAALRHVVRDVGDVHAEPEVPVRQPVERDRVVEVAGVLAVDGDGRAAAGSRCGRSMSRFVDLGAQALRLCDRVLGVRVGDAELADDDLGVDARLVDVAEHFRDPAERAARSRSASG